MSIGRNRESSSRTRLDESCPQCRLDGLTCLQIVKPTGEKGKVSVMLERFLVGAVCLLFAASCTHILTIENLPATQLHSTTLARPITLGVVNSGGIEETEQYVQAIAQSLRLAASIERVIYPCTNTGNVDVVANVSVDPEYRGALTNFLVNWPGFLVFAPAWNGYLYRANPRTRVQLTTPQGKSLETISWEHEYEFHQADMGRTWTEIGWLEYSVIPLIAGIVFIQYDTDQTPAFIGEVKDNYGNQVAAQITQRLPNIPLPDISPPR